MRGAVPTIRAVVGWCALALCGALVACAPSPLTRADTFEFTPYFIKCGAQGEACCRPPGTHPPSLGPLVACQTGLGCNIQTNTCEQPCGGTGQVCCDGPETRAPKWTADGKVYSPNTWDMQEMCRAGACDVNSHRCIACGTVEGQPCCGPDAAQATARCVGERLFCEFTEGTFYRSGICRACGIQGRVPCEWGCDAGLDLLKGLCQPCGSDGQVPCDKGCKPGLGMANGLCRACGGLNQIPCDKGCAPGLGVLNGVCARCGGVGQPPCQGGCGPGTRLLNGVCVQCGGLNQPPCDKGCNYPYRVSNGVCKPCGAQGQVPCDVGCNSGLAIVNGVCQQPGASDPSTCAKQGEACSADFVNSPTPKCCNPPGTSNPLLCVYGSCKQCVPRGQQCVPFGPQLCCQYGDQCVLDPSSAQTVCNVPG